MLYLETLDSSTYDLLKQLQAEDLLRTTYLVGGTSIAIRKGYRKSVDLDLFMQEDFDAERLSLFLQKKYNFKETFKRENTLKGDINHIKIDIISYNYVFIQEPEVEDGIRMLSIPDIIAMKLSAISGNGMRVKDFVDIAFLSQDYSLEQMIEFYIQKYPNSNPIGVMLGINYFDEIDFTDPVNLIRYEYDWKYIEKRLLQMTKNYKKVFSVCPYPISKLKESFKQKLPSVVKKDNLISKKGKSRHP